MVLDFCPWSLDPVLWPRGHRHLGGNLWERSVYLWGLGSREAWTERERERGKGTGGLNSPFKALPSVT